MKTVKMYFWKAFAQDQLQKHNDFRAKHGVQPLELDDELSRSAEAYAKKLADENNGIHHSDSGSGENLFAGCGMTEADATTAW